MRIIIIISAITGIIAGGIAIGSDEPPGPPEPLGVVTISSVTDPVWPPRVRVMNDQADSVTIWLETGDHVVQAVLGTVGPKAVQTFPLPRTAESVRIVAEASDGSQYFTGPFDVSGRIDIPLVVPAR